MNWDTVKEAFGKSKMIVLAIGFTVTSFVGAYNMAGEFFMTKVNADQIIKNVEIKLEELQKQTVANKNILTEMRLIRLENKMQSNIPLTPTEDRMYKKLLKEYNEIK